MKALRCIVLMISVFLISSYIDAAIQLMWATADPENDEYIAVPLEYAFLSPTIKLMTEEDSEYLEKGIPFWNMSQKTLKMVVEYLQKLYDNKCKGDTGPIVMDWVSDEQMVAFNLALQYLDIDNNQKNRENDCATTLVKLKDILNNNSNYDQNIDCVLSEMSLLDKIESGFCCSPDGSYIAFVGNRELKIFDTESKELVSTFPYDDNSATPKIKFSCNGKYIVCGTKIVRVWDIQKGFLVAKISGFESFGVQSIAFNNDATCIVIGGWDGTITIVDLEKKCKFVFQDQHNGHVCAVSFSNNNQYVISGSADKTIKIWDIKNQSLICTLEGHTDEVRSVQFFGQNDENIISGAKDCVKIWNRETTSLIYDLPIKCWSFVSAHVSEDGKYIIVVTDYNTIKIFNLENLTFIGELLGKNDERYFFFSHVEQNYVVTGFFNGKVNIINMNKLINYLCDLLIGNNLT